MLAGNTSLVLLRNNNTLVGGVKIGYNMGQTRQYCREGQLFETVSWHWWMVLPWGAIAIVGDDVILLGWYCLGGIA